jgi:hypothetical protein
MPESSPRTYAGTCHCGAVRIAVTMPPPEKAFACNCSICSRSGWLLAFVSDSDLHVDAGPDALSDYLFGKKQTHHLFCRTCGVRCFSRGTDGEGKAYVAVNLRCLSGLELGRLPVETFDGASA